MSKRSIKISVLALMMALGMSIIPAYAALYCPEASKITTIKAGKFIVVANGITFMSKLSDYQKSAGVKVTAFSNAGYNDNTNANAIACYYSATNRFGQNVTMLPANPSNYINVAPGSGNKWASTPVKGRYVCISFGGQQATVKDCPFKSK